MKKIFTLAFGLLMTVALFAADRRPTVLLNSAGNFEVVIDGRSFVTNGRIISLDRLHNGRHTIQVFELRRGYYGRHQKRLVSQSSFRVTRNDMMIRIARNGQIMIKERTSSYIGYGSGRDDRGYQNGRDDRSIRNNRIDPNVRRNDNDWDDDDERDWRGVPR
jgi:hypothetical protein